MPTVAHVDAETLEREGAPGDVPEFSQLVRIIWRLRQKDGCPWDREQTHESIRANMLEEAYEVAGAIDEADDAHLAEELGDVLMQVLLHSQMAADEGSFDIRDVVRGLNEKLVRRHPHVFGDRNAENESEALAAWESVKDAERAQKTMGTVLLSSSEASENAPDAPSLSSAPDVPASLSSAPDAPSSRNTVAGLLDSVPRAMPALMECQKISKRAARAGFDWPSVEAVWEKVDEERAELEAEEPGSPAWEAEFGDLLFSLVNVARKEGVSAERALERANEKFRQRWAAVEELCANEGVAPTDCSTARLNELWDLVKTRE